MKKQINNNGKSSDLQHAIEEANIRQQLEDHVEALFNLDLKRVMSIYASDIVSFDVEGTYLGLEEKRKAWTKLFSMIEPPLKYEIRNLSVTAGDGAAFGYSHNRLHAKLKNGQQIDSRVRYTACFMKYDGGWLIAHEQVSMPVDFESGKSVPDYK